MIENPVITVSARGEVRYVASVGDFDFNWTSTSPTPPDEPDTNPYGVLATRDGAYVADAAALVAFVARSGRISVVRPFVKNDPNNYPIDSLPSCVARGPEERCSSRTSRAGSSAWRAAMRSRCRCLCSTT